MKTHWTERTHTHARRPGNQQKKEHRADVPEDGDDKMKQVEMACALTCVLDPALPAGKRRIVDADPDAD